MDSVLSIFSIGIGPSSSHTLAPMRAAGMFLDLLKRAGIVERVQAVRIDLYGSLSLTGLGHLTDRAVLLGLAGFKPETVDVDAIPAFMERVKANRELPLADGLATVPFDYNQDLVFHREFLPLHENGMRFTATVDSGKTVAETYYSVGGGIVTTEADFGKKRVDCSVPRPFATAAELIAKCVDNSLSIAELALDNERAITSEDAVRRYCRDVWNTMKDSMKRGMETSGALPGPLRVPRRAPGLRGRLKAQQNLSRDPFLIMDWINLFALAVSEENAAGGRVVTAPTNGSCGVVPAVMEYYNRFVLELDDDLLMRFLLTAGAIGLLYRENASLSGAEVGCQGEIGVACSIAAAGLTELMGGSPGQVATAAEIGMEHNLGLTCDPVNGQVQIPCIERNAVNAVKAINSSRMAMERASPSRISLDNVMAAMMATGKDMNAKYRETAQGGLAALPPFSGRG